jgi:hypothetical protein
LGIPVFFTPSVYHANAISTDGIHFTSWGQTYIGSLNYLAGADPQTDINGSNNLAAINAANGKPNVLDLNGGPYWSFYNNPHQYFEHFGGEGPDSAWRAAIALNPIFVMEAVWNDFPECYTSLIPVASIIDNQWGEQPTLLPHACYSELRKYYTQWYATGVQPTITRDLLMPRCFAAIV